MRRKYKLQKEGIHFRTPSLQHIFENLEYIPHANLQLPALRIIIIGRISLR